MIGFGSGLVFIPIFDYILGDATNAEAGAGSGMLNAVQQFANAVGFAAVAAALYLVTLPLVGLLPRQARQAATSTHTSTASSKDAPT